MITVTVSINGAPILGRSARNTGVVDAAGRTRYHLDDDSTVWHRREDGAVKLAKMMLDTIKEP